MKRNGLVALAIALFLLAVAGTACAQEDAVLYIGMRDTGFTEYAVSLPDELTADALIESIEALTGWKMDLLEPVTSGKGGMSVGFGPESALFKGPAEPQTEGFEVLDGYQLAHTLLDSVQKTLQMNFTAEGGDPDALCIYYFMQDDQPLTIESIGMTFPIDEPYQWPEVQ